METDSEDDIYDLAALDDFEGLVGSLKKTVESDSASLQGWHHKAAYDLAARYGSVGMSGQANYADGSRIYIPVEDKYVTRHRAVESSALLDHDFFARLTPTDDLGSQNAVNASLYMGALTDGRHPTYAIRDFRRTWTHGIDDAISCGFSGFHVEPEMCYEDRATREIGSNDLPPVLNKLIIGKWNKKERAAFAIEAESRGMELNDTLVMETFGEAVNPVDQETFRRISGKIASLLVNHLDLDSGETDRAALDTIMRWMKAGGPLSESPSVAVMTRVLTRHSISFEQIPPEFCIAPIWTSRLRTAPRVTVIRPMFDHDLVSRSKHAGWYGDKVDDVLSRGASSSSSNLLAYGIGTLWNFRRWRLSGGTGTFEQDNAPHMIATTYTWADLKNKENPTKFTSKSIMERIRVDWDTESGHVLRFSRFGSRINAWPVADIRFDESAGPLYGSRGLPRLIHDMSMSVNAMHRARHDYIAMTSCFTGVARRQTVPTSGNAMRMEFGSFIEVDEPDDIKFASWPATTPAFMERDEMMTSQWIDDYIGEVSPSRQRGNSDDAATATEVRAVENKSRALISARMSALLGDASEVGNLIWQTAQESAPSEFWVMATGTGPQMLRGLDVQGGYHVSLSANPEDASPDVVSQKALARWRISGEAQKMHGRDARYSFDPATAAFKAIQALGLSDSRDVARRLSPDEERKRIEALQAEAEQAKQIEEIGKKIDAGAPLTDEEVRVLGKHVRLANPHRGVQKVMQGAQETQDAAEQAAMMEGMG